MAAASTRRAGTGSVSAPPARRDTAGVPAAVLAEIAAAGALDAGDLDPALLGNFLVLLSGAVAGGRRLTRGELQPCQAAGQEAARRGVPLRALLDLYLSAAWRLWRHLPAVADAARDPAGVVTGGEVMLRALDDGVAALAESFQLARRSLLRAQESARREFIDDLLSGVGAVTTVLSRAAGFGLDLTGPHAVVVVRAEQPFSDGSAVIGAVERAVLGSLGDAEALVASKEGLLVVVFAAPDRAAITEVTDRLATTLGPRPGEPDRVQLRRRVGVGDWQLGLGRPRVGPQGVRASYEEALNALDLAAGLGLETAIVDAGDLLVYEVLLRDRTAISDLVDALLTPLVKARGGAEPLLDTLATYYETGGNVASTARSMHLSVRAVTYRLARVQSLTGRDPTASAQRFAMHAAVLGAKLLGWPSGNAAPGRAAARSAQA